MCKYLNPYNTEHRTPELKLILHFLKFHFSIEGKQKIDMAPYV